MSETALSIIVFFHLIFIAVWVGSQILVAAAVVPSLRRVSQGEERLAALQEFTRRFNHVAWGSMLIIVITGGLMVNERIDQVKAIFGDSILDARWGWIFVIKMTLWVLMLAAVAAHSWLVGPRQLELNRQALQQDDAWSAQHLRPLQRRSIMLSVTGLVLSLLVLGSGAFLANHGYSFRVA